MYLWYAANADGPLSALRARARQATLALRSANPVLTLPLHVSLRISFPVADGVFARAVSRTEACFASLAPFEIRTAGIEKNGSVVWLKMAENATLRALHQRLVALHEAEFGVAPHAFDRAFVYHASLFMDEDAAKLDAAYAALRGAPYPKAILVTSLLAGCSQTGRAGEYRVIKEYSLGGSHDKTADHF